MKKNLTEVVFIIDESGSMSGLESDVVGGFNSTLKTQKEKDGECLVSTVFFDNHQTVIHDRIDIRKIEPMQVKDYNPGGCTALVDTIASSIKYIKKVHKIIREEDVPENTMFIITTDGMENASVKYSSDELKKMIEEQKKRGWQFVYLAANVDAVETGKNLGFSRKESVDYMPDPTGNKAMYNSINAAISSVRACGKVCDSAFEEVTNDFKKRNKK